MKPMRLFSWALALGLAGALAFLVGLPKFIGPEPNPIFSLIAGRTGVSSFEPYVRYATGSAELTAALRAYFVSHVERVAQVCTPATPRLAVN